MVKRKEIRQRNITQLGLVLIIIILLNILSTFIFGRIDLTAEKRYTLTETTVNFLEQMDDVVYFQIYLEGEALDPGFRRLQNATREMLDEMRNYTGDNIQYEFIDPFESPDFKTRGEIGRQLLKKGLRPTTIEQMDDNGGTSEQLLFVGAIVSYRGEEVPLELLKNNLTLSGEENLNNSIQSLEFELIQTISKLSNFEKKRIAFIEGHGELSDLDVADFTISLKEFYEVESIRINGDLSSLRGVDCIIVAKPDSAVSEKDKFVLDQYIMNGGKALWLIDAVDVDMDSLSYTGAVLGMINQTNLEDQLFRYGVRVNADLIQDMNCGALAVNTSAVGSQPKFRLFPWVYFPLLLSNSNHIITKNLDLITTQFVSTLDTVGNNSEVRKHFLLSSSNRCRTINAPARISLEIIKDPLKEAYFPKAFIPTAVLMEGSFESVFQNRLPSSIANSDEIKFKAKSIATKMIVVADGDLIRNQIRQTENGPAPFPLGYDRHTDVTFSGNKDFALNAINYLVDDKGIMGVRSRELKLRLLDKGKIKNEKLKWQLINTLVPVLFIIFFGLFVNWYRRKKYAA
jgi:ABC-2 type transport system permease protein